MKIKSYPAKNGDAFLIKTDDESFVMLVDGGYSQTFQQYIKPDLEQISANGNELNLVVATHIDADHISGLITFFDMNGSADSPALIPVKKVLHNSLRSFTSSKPRNDYIRPDDLAISNEIRSQGYLINEDEGSDQEISARQGVTLSQLLIDGGYDWNDQEGYKSVGRNGISTLDLAGATITILGPNQERIEDLKKWWISEVRRLGWIGSIEGYDDIFEYLCAREVASDSEVLLSASDEDLATSYSPDNSVTNGSSISFILEIYNLKLLFLGDSWAEDIISVLRPGGLSHFDAIKISHHGSQHNTSCELLTLVDSPHFFISTNGSGHDHPDYAVLKAIVDRPSEFTRTLHFNYSTSASKKLKSYQDRTKADFIIEEDQTDWVEIN